MTALSTGEIYFYRIMAENAAGQSWSEVATFSTGDFDLVQIQLQVEICSFG